MSTSVVVAADLPPGQTSFPNDDLEEKISQTSIVPDVTASKKKAGNRLKVRKSGAVDEDFDDNASVSSNMSSASEHSVKSDNKVKKTKKVHCEVHLKSSKSKVKESCTDDVTTESKKSGGIIDGDDLPADGETAETNQLKCTCRKNAKNRISSKAKVMRPEPEGSLLSDPTKLCFLDDLERVIYSTDPLFSDVEDEDPTLEDQIRTESERFHRRITDPENIFSAVQMLNTNTMMKLAIIQTELKNVKDVSLRRSEGEILSAAKRAEVLRESFEHTENSFKSVSSQLNEVSKAAGPRERGQQLSAQVCRGNVDEKKQSLSIDKEQRLGIVSPDVVTKRKSFFGKRIVNDVDLEIAECCLEAAEMKICEIEEEQMVISNARKSRNTSEFEEIIRRLSQRLLQAEKQAQDAEQTIFCLGKQLQDFQDESSAEKKKHKAISAEIKASFAELSTFLS